MLDLQQLDQQGKLNYAEVESKNELLMEAGYDFIIVFLEIQYPYFAYSYHLESVADYHISNYQSTNVVELTKSNKLTDPKRNRKLLPHFTTLLFKLTRKNFATGIKRVRNGFVLAAAYIGQFLTPFEVNPKDFQPKQLTEIHKTNSHKYSTFETIAVEGNAQGVAQSSGSGTGGGQDSGSSIIPGATGFGTSNYPSPRPGSQGSDSGLFISPHDQNPSGGSNNPGGGASGGSNNPSSSKQQRFEHPADSYPYLYQPEESESESSDDEIFKCRRGEVVSRINESRALIREAERMGKDQAAQKDVNNLIEQLALGNKSPGIGNRRVKGLKNVSEARGRNEGRVYFREKDGNIEILAKSNKDNQDTVIDILQKMGYSYNNIKNLS